MAPDRGDAVIGNVLRSRFWRSSTYWGRGISAILSDNGVCASDPLHYFFTIAIEQHPYPTPARVRLAENH